VHHSLIICSMIGFGGLFDFVMNSESVVPILLGQTWLSLEVTLLLEPDCEGLQLILVIRHKIV